MGVDDYHEHSRKEPPVYRVAFGIGCWNFGLRHKGSFAVDLNHYVALLKAELEKVPSLDALEIVTLDDEDVEFDEGDLRESDAGPALFADESLLEVTFDLYIPFRIQKEVAGPGFLPSETNAENFRVHIRYPYYGPVSFVSLINDGECSSPSTAIRIVRKYIDFQLKSLSDDVVFEFVGPSPFHADLRVEGYATPNQTTDIFECEQSRRPGYADITFRCCTKNFETEGEACEALFDGLEDELGLFYGIHRDDFSRRRDWGKIEQLTSNLSEGFKTTGWHKSLWAAGATGRDLAALHFSLVQFEAAHLLNKHSTERAYRETYDRKRLAFLKDFLESAIKDRPVFPMRQMAELMEFIEKRRSKSVELLIIMMAALIGGLMGLIGGVLGSLITSMVK